MRILSLGAGVQSSALLYMSLSGDIAPYDKVIFADTGNEPKAVYNHLASLKALAGDTLMVVSSGNIIEDAMGKSRFATMPMYVKEAGKVSVLRRQCTREYKIAPVSEAIRALAYERGLAYVSSGSYRIKKGVKIELHMGISIDESHRMSKPRTQWQVNVYPLVERAYTRYDAYRYAVNNNYPIPPKSSCIICPYHDDTYWLSLSLDEFKIACDFDDFLRSGNFKTKLRGDLYLHRSCKPLREVAFKANDDKPMQLGFKLEALNSCSSDSFSCYS